MNTLYVSLRFFCIILAELTVLFLGISTLVGMVFEYISEETIRHFLAKRGGWQGNFLGAALGAITPFCSCSTIPMTVGLLRAGVPFGSTMSFLLASPLLNPIILTMFLTLLGWKACVTYGLVTFIMSMVSGYAFANLGLAKEVKNVRIKGGEHTKETLLKFSDKLCRAFMGAWSDFRSVLPYIIGGVGIGAAVYGYVPSELVARLAGPQNPLAIPVAAIIGIPLYVRTETVIPIAVALTQKGMNLGAVIALIIGGAGMSIPEVSMLGGIFKKRLVLAFICVVFITAVLAGFIFNTI